MNPNPQTTDPAAAQVAASFSKDISILRQVIYKEVQMWKRQLWKNHPNTDMDLYSCAALTEDDKVFIDSEVLWLLKGEIPERLLKQLAEVTLKDLLNTTNKSVAQKSFEGRLQTYLTGQPF